jgi:hypothetical protein
MSIKGFCRDIIFKVAAGNIAILENEVSFFNGRLQIVDFESEFVRRSGNIRNSFRILNCSIGLDARPARCGQASPDRTKNNLTTLQLHPA